MTTLPRVAARRCIRWAQLDILTLYYTTYFTDKQTLSTSLEGVDSVAHKYKCSLSTGSCFFFFLLASVGNSSSFGILFLLVLLLLLLLLTLFTHTHTLRYTLQSRGSSIPRERSLLESTTNTTNDKKKQKIIHRKSDWEITRLNFDLFALVFLCTFSFFYPLSSLSLRNPSLFLSFLSFPFFFSDQIFAFPSTLFLDTHAANFFFRLFFLYFPCSFSPHSFHTHTKQNSLSRCSRIIFLNSPGKTSSRSLWFSRKIVVVVAVATILSIWKIVLHPTSDLLGLTELLLALL